MRLSNKLNFAYYRKNTQLAKLAFCLLIIFSNQFSIHASLAATNIINEMNALINEGRYIEAYEIGKAGLFENEGEPEFDFLYGLVALEAGEPAEAVFAFERIAFNYSDQQRAKLELARAYFLSNNLVAADKLFREVLATEPAPNVANNINSFLDIIEQRRRAFTSSFNWNISSALGSDSNINSATDLGVIDTPIGDIILNSAGQRIEDEFIDTSAGLNYTHPINKNSAFSVSGNFNRHNNFSTDQFDLDILAADFAYVIGHDNYQLNTSLRAQKVDLDKKDFQKSNSFISTIQRLGTNGWSQSLTGAYTSIRYDTALNPNNKLRNVNQLLASGMLVKASESLIHNLTIYLGEDKALHDAGKNNASNFYGFAFTEQYLLMPGHIPYFRMSLHKNNDKGVDPIFNIIRKDKTFSTSLGWIWQANRSINLTADITYTDNDSNLDLYAFDKLKYQAVLRYQF